METKQSLNVVRDEEQCDRQKSQKRDNQDNSKSGAIPKANRVVHGEKSLKDLQVLGTEVGECDEIVHAICKHLPKLLIMRLVNKKWCEIASNILHERSNIWISLSKQVNVRGDELESWSNVNPSSRNNSKLTALNRLLEANANFPCQNYWISVGVQGSSGSPSTFIAKYIDRIRSLHFDVQEIPFVLVFANLMATTGFVALQNVQNVQIEHGPYDWGLSRQVVPNNAPRLNRLKKLTLPGNLICDQTRWREVLREAVTLERIENCTLPFLPEIINQKKTSLVKSIYLRFHRKPNPAIGLTLQENVNVFVQAVQQGLTLEDILAFDIEVFISPHTKADCNIPEKLPPQATLTKWYQSAILAFNGLLKNSEGTLKGIRNISCLGYASKGTASGGCLTHIEIPRMTKMREIDWLTLHDNSLMKMDFLFPLNNFLASRCFPNIQDVMCDPSKECWKSLSLKSSSDLKQLTGRMSMPSASRLFWFCSQLDSIGHHFINRNRDCTLIQHLLHPIFPNLVTLSLPGLISGQIPNVLTKIFQFYSNTLQELKLSNRSDEVVKISKNEMWCLDVSIIGLPESFLNILRENFKDVQVNTVQLFLTRPSIRSMKCLRKLSLSLYDPNHFHGGNIPLISELSQLYGFDFLPKLKIVTVDSKENFFDACSSDEEEQQQDLEDAGSGNGYYQRYKYYQQSKEQNVMVNVNQPLESLEDRQMEKQQMKVELLFLKGKIEEKLKHLKNGSEIKELKNILQDVTSHLNSV